jgi:hypothetical protein
MTVRVGRSYCHCRRSAATAHKAAIPRVKIELAGLLARAEVRDGEAEGASGLRASRCRSAQRRSPWEAFMLAGFIVKLARPNLKLRNDLWLDSNLHKLAASAGSLA